MENNSISLKSLASGLDFIRVFGELKETVSGISFDSRDVKKGDIFVAIRGSTTNGNTYRQHAMDTGAIAIVSEEPPIHDFKPYIQVPDARKALAVLASRFYDAPDKHLNLIGITGTNGKSTTAYLIRSILQSAGLATGLLGTIEYIIGDERTPAKHTTPDALRLHKLLADIRNAGITHVVMEVSSHALAQERTYGLEFKKAVFTNFSREHLDFHETEENYLLAKSKLFKALDKNDLMILNIDDPVSAQIQKMANARVWHYGVYSNDARFTGKITHSSLSGMEAELNLKGQRLKVKSNLIGEFNLYNLLAAAAVGVSFNLDLQAIKAGIESVEIIPGRLERVPSKQPFAVFIDFAHTPAALKQLLLTIRQVCGGRIILVFGCGGERDQSKRPEMGRIAEELTEHIILTSDNPRSESPNKILKDIDPGISDKSKRNIVPDRESAIFEALKLAREGDVVLITGKGHETYQEIDGQKHPFDDRVATKEQLEQL